MATINFFYKLEGVIGDNTDLIAGSLSVPAEITAASGLGSDTTYNVPTATVFTLTDDLDSSANVVMIISPVNATLEWNSSTEANNSSVGILANVPFIIANPYTTEYSAVASTRASNDLDEPILEIRIIHAAGSTKKVRVITFD